MGHFRCQHVRDAAVCVIHGAEISTAESASGDGLTSGFGKVQLGYGRPAAQLLLLLPCICSVVAVVVGWSVAANVDQAAQQRTQTTIIATTTTSSTSIAPPSSCTQPIIVIRSSSSSTTTEGIAYAYPQGLLNLCQRLHVRIIEVVVASNTTEDAAAAAGAEDVADDGILRVDQAVCGALDRAALLLDDQADSSSSAVGGVVVGVSVDAGPAIVQLRFCGEGHFIFIVRDSVVFKEIFIWMVSND